MGTERSCGEDTRGERGQVLVLAALMLVVLLGMTALATDVGLVMKTRRDGQNAADAAALAGASVIVDGGSTASARAEAQRFANLNGFGQNAVVNVPPARGNRAGDRTCVEVEVTRTQRALFAVVLGQDGWEVPARAVACGEGQPKAYGIIALNRSRCGAITMNSNVEITINGAGIFDNSACSNSAFIGNSNVRINTTANDVVGGWTLNSNVRISPPLAHAGHIEDPLAGLPEPTPPSGPQQSCPDFRPNRSYTLDPGVYDCPLVANSNVQVEFRPGNYYFRRGVTFNSNVDVRMGAGIYTFGDNFILNSNVTIRGDGVTFYQRSGCMIMNSNSSTFDVRAPTSGTYRGILFFQARNNTCPIVMNSNVSVPSWGTLYAPAAQVTWNSNIESGLQMIVDSLIMNSNVEITINFDGLTLAQVKRAALVE